MSFEELLARISPKLKGITRKLNWCSITLSEDDLYQEAVLRLWHDYKDDKLSDKTDSYILQGCYFFLRNYIRKVKDKAEIVSMEVCDYPGGSNEWDRSSLMGPRDWLENEDLQRMAEKLMNSGLDEREIKFLSLFSQRLSIREIGRISGVSHVMVIKMRERIKNKCLALKVSL